MLIHLLSDFVRDEGLRLRLAANAIKVLDEYGVPPDVRDHLRARDIGQLLGRIVAESYDMFAEIAAAQAAPPGEGQPDQEKGALSVQGQAVVRRFLGGLGGAVEMPWPPEGAVLVTDVDPGTAPLGQPVIFTIRGASFAPGASVRFEQPGGRVFQASSVTFQSESTICATATITTEGGYAVVVTNPSGAHGRRDMAVQVRGA